MPVTCSPTAPPPALTQMPELEVVPVDDASFDDIPEPARTGARCQTCDYWERIDGGREAPGADDPGATARASLKRGRLLAAHGVTGPYAMLGYRTDTVDRVAVAYAQFGPMSVYPRAQSIRDRYPQLPESPAPWVVTCLQVTPESGDGPTRQQFGTELLEAVCAELDRRGITAVEAYPEVVAEAWMPSPGPVALYESAGFERVAGDEHYPVYRRELSGETAADAWSDLLRAAAPDEGDDWPLPVPGTPSGDDFFRLPPEKPKRPNPFGDD
jgi:ribosomal protein S18 acetylase RimI-like enzyme